MSFDPLDFQPNSVGVMVVRVIRLKDIIKALNCTEDFAQQVVREIRGETNADGSLAFVLPSQLARWTYQRAGEAVAPPPFTTVVKDTRRGVSRADPPPPAPSGSTSLKEIRSDLRRLKSATIQPGAAAVTLEQAAARLGCSRSRVFELLKDGSLKRAPKVGRSTLVTLASVDQLLTVPMAAPKPQRTHPGKSTAQQKADILKLIAKSTRAADRPDEPG